jgi:hypothetical protein
MKNTLILLIILFFAFACADIEQFESTPINLGAKSTSTEILSVTTVGGKVTAMFAVTTGAKYSVQVYPFAATDPVKSLPLTAEEEIVTKVYDFTELPDGLYDLTLTDISGVSIKKPIIIKR